MLKPVDTAQSGHKGRARYSRATEKATTPTEATMRDDRNHRMKTDNGACSRKATAKREMNLPQQIRE